MSENYVTYGDLTAQPINLLNTEEIVMGYKISSNPNCGSLSADLNYNATGFMSAVGGKTYISSYLGSKGVRVKNGTCSLFAYDRNKICIGYGSNPYTVPAETAYIRMSVWHGHCTDLQIEEFSGEWVTVTDEEGNAVEKPVLADYEEYGTYTAPEIREFKTALLDEALSPKGSFIKETDDADQISRTFAAAEGTVVFPQNTTFELSKKVVMENKSNLILDLNGCTLKPSEDFTANRILLELADCENVVIRNGIFDCDAKGKYIDESTGTVVSRIMGLYSHNSSITIKDCVFKNSNYHHIWVKNGCFTGENITFIDLQDDANYVNGTSAADTSSDVYAHCDDDGYVETHWQNIRSERETLTGDKVFYFGVTTDTQKCYHTVDGLWAKNAVNTIELRGGEGYFKNIYAENVKHLISQHNGVTEANAPIVTFENVHFKNIVGAGVAPIRILAGRRVRLRNVLIEAPDWAEHSEYNRVIDVLPLDSRLFPIRDVVISDVRYTGAAVFAGVYIKGDVQCTLDNVVIDAEVTDAGIFFVDETDTTDLTVSNYKCDNKIVSATNASGVANSANIHHIRMKNTHQAIGTTGERPELFPCETAMYYDTDFEKPVFWNGSAWVDI